MARVQERLPEWFRVDLPRGRTASEVVRRLRGHHLNTVCEEARCPNMGQCWAEGTATLLILGSVCTRNCRFCAVATGHPGGQVDPEEPGRVAASIKASGLRYVVLTSVDRDDLADGGSAHYAETIRAIRRSCPSVHVEVLIPDYLGDSLATVLKARPDVVGHNIEVVRRITPQARDRRATYDRSLQVLGEAASGPTQTVVKSSLMLGLGETRDEVIQALQDLRSVGVTLITMGQYLRPTIRHIPVQRYLPPAEFDELAVVARDLGFVGVASGPLVRSSYLAERLFQGRKIQ